MKNHFTVFIWLIAFTVNLKAGAVEIVTPHKSDEITKIRNYDGKWKVLGKFGDVWEQNSTITERLYLNKKGNWQHVQKQIPINSPNKGTVSTRLIRANDLFVNNIVIDIGSPSEGQPKKVIADFTNRKVMRKFEFADGKVIDNQPETVLPFNGFDGLILGLVLSSFELENDKSFRLPVVIAGDLTQYWVDAYVKDGGEVMLYGQKQRVWQVDTQWLDVNTGVTNPPGPDSSGGSYYILKKPESGLAAVYRYKNTTVDIILE